MAVGGGGTVSLDSKHDWMSYICFYAEKWHSFVGALARLPVVWLMIQPWASLLIELPRPQLALLNSESKCGFGAFWKHLKKSRISCHLDIYPKLYQTKWGMFFIRPGKTWKNHPFPHHREIAVASPQAKPLGPMSCISQTFLNSLKTWMQNVMTLPETNVATENWWWKLLCFGDFVCFQGFRTVFFGWIGSCLNTVTMASCRVI